MIHRDLKPDNVLLTHLSAGGGSAAGAVRAAVGDFGTSRLIEQLTSTAITTTTTGTDASMTGFALAGGGGASYNKRPLSTPPPVVSSSATMTRNTGTMLYSAPEILSGSRHYDAKVCAPNV